MGRRTSIKEKQVGKSGEKAARELLESFTNGYRRKMIMQWRDTVDQMMDAATNPYDKKVAACLYVLLHDAIGQKMDNESIVEVIDRHADVIKEHDEYLVRVDRWLRILSEGILKIFADLDALEKKIPPNDIENIKKKLGEYEPIIESLKERVKEKMKEKEYFENIQKESDLRLKNHVGGGYG